MVHMISGICPAKQCWNECVGCGTDEVEGTRRSDVLLSYTSMSKQKSVRLLSIPRDTRSNIPDVGVSKINHAYAYGGVKLIKQNSV